MQDCFGQAGIAPDLKPDEQLEFHGRVDHHDDQNSTKQYLISSYKKNIYPVLKADINQNLQDSSSSTVISSKSSKRKHCLPIGAAVNYYLLPSVILLKTKILCLHAFLFFICVDIFN